MNGTESTYLNKYLWIYVSILVCQYCKRNGRIFLLKRCDFINKETWQRVESHKTEQINKRIICNQQQANCHSLHLNQRWLTTVSSKVNFRIFWLFQTFLQCNIPHIQSKTTFLILGLWINVASLLLNGLGSHLSSLVINLRD